MQIAFPTTPNLYSTFLRYVNILEEVLWCLPTYYLSPLILAWSLDPLLFLWCSDVEFRYALFDRAWSIGVLVIVVTKLLLQYNVVGDSCAGCKFESILYSHVASHVAVVDDCTLLLQMTWLLFTTSLRITISSKSLMRISKSAPAIVNISSPVVIVVGN